MTDPIFVAGIDAAREGVNWWDNPHPSGSSEAGRWDKGHTSWRTKAVAVLPEFPPLRGLTLRDFDLIRHGCTTEPTDSFAMLSMIFGDGAEAFHGGPSDLTVWNRHTPGTARYAAFALGYGCRAALWEAGEG